MSLIANLSSPRCMKLALPVGANRSMIVNCFGEALSTKLIEVELLHSKLSAENLDFDREYRLSYLEGEQVVVISGPIKALLNEEKLHLSVKDITVRDHQRGGLRVNTRAGLKYWEAGEKKEASTHDLDALVNLSGGGICFAATRHFDMDSKVSLEVVLPGIDAPAICDGIVKRVSGFGRNHWLVALQFEGLDMGTQESLEVYCSALSVDQIQNQESHQPYDQLLQQEIAVGC